ncbi:MAG: FAD-binding protein [Nitrososphaerales archaeon]
MTSGEIADKRLSRRQFVGSAAAGAAALGAAAGATALVPKAGAVPTRGGGVAGSEYEVAVRGQPVPVPSSWSQTADVVVVGYGGSGAVSAITAFDAGASVIVLEKTPSLASLGVSPVKAPNQSFTISGGGGNTHMSGGNIAVPTNAIDGANFIYAASWGRTPLDVCQAWASVAVNIEAWLTAMGIPFTTNAASAATGGFANLPGAASYHYVTAVGDGPALFAGYDTNVQSRNIPVLFNTQATDLIQNPMTGEILGVQALANNSEIVNVRANRAVILTCGGYEYDETMKANYLPVYPSNFIGWPANTGDGIRMAQKVGAGLWHMNTVAGSYAAWIPEIGPIAFSVSAKTNGWIYVDTSGNRFWNENDASGDDWTLALANFNPDAPQYARIPTFLVFDEVARKAGAIGPTTTSYSTIPTQLGGTTYVWSSDNSAEIAKGWIIEGATSPSDLANAINSATIASTPAGTPRSLASQMVFNIKPATLTATINAWNAECAAGTGDTLFGRAASAMAPLQTPPFYAIPLWPSGPNTLGGPIHNAQSQVCDPDNKPIPRLYAAGECGSNWGFLYPGRGNNSENIAFGQISGHNAATEVPWTS